MKTTTNNRVLYLSISDLEYGSKLKYDEGKLKLEEITDRNFSWEIKGQIRIADVAMLTHGNSKHVIKTRL